MGALKVGWPGHVLTAALIGASYPLALAGHSGLDWLFGDALLLREWQYGSRRAVAFGLVDAWVAALAWAAGFWLAAAWLRRRLGRAYAAVVGVICAALLGAAAARAAPVPSILAWLLLTCVVLDAGNRALAARRRVEPCA